MGTKRARGSAAARSLARLAAICLLGGPAYPQAAAPWLPDSGPARTSAPTTRCLLTRISDGDSIRCEGLGRVRLIGLDAPEVDQKPFGTASAAGLASLAPVGSVLALEVDVEARDRFGRLLAYAWLDGVMINWALIRLGWAVPFPYPPNTRYADLLARAGATAEREGRGLWSVAGFACRPADHRRRAC